MDNLSLIYKITLIIGAIANIFMAASLIAGQKVYRKYVIYMRARQFAILWLLAFAAGYLIHAFLEIRTFWPTAATAITVSYFHIGAICFCWGFIPLLNPNYFTRRIAVRDTIIFGVELILCWTVVMIWKQSSFYTALPFLIFFGYCAFNVYVFYKTFHRVSFRLLTMSYGNVRSFVHWMQISCDIIIFFGIFLVALVLMFPNAIRYFTPIETIAGIGLFAYIVRSLSRYGKVVEDATRATENIAELDNQ